MNTTSFENLLRTVPVNTRKAEALKVEFALGLVRLLEKHQISHSDFAKRVGVSAAYISKVLRGDTNVTIETMVKLASGTHGDVHIRVTDAGKNFAWAGKHNGRRPSITNAQPIRRRAQYFYGATASKPNVTMPSQGAA